MAGNASRQNGKKGGRPKGKKTAATLEKEAVRAAFNARVLKVTDLLLDAQLVLARGTQHLYKIEKELQIGPKGGKRYVKSKPILVTSQWEIEAYLEGQVEDGDLEDENDPNATYYFITTEKPDNKAIDSMLDRVFDKARQRISGPDGGPITLSFDNAFTPKAK